MKKVLFIVLLLAVSTSLFASLFHSVPLNNEAYRIIEVAQIRGIIETQSDVKPYNLNTVRNLLNQISDSSYVSDSERVEIARILSEFDYLYGTEQSTGRDIFKNGYFRDSFLGNTTTAGVRLVSLQTGGISSIGNKILDSRNIVEATVNGDILDVVSYDLNFNISMDRVDADAFLPTEVYINCDGFYMNLLEGGKRMRNLPDTGLYTGIEAFPEISTSIKDDIFTARIGTVKRSWGPGLNNLALSSSARAFDGFEFSLKPTSWFRYDVILGSLGMFSLDYVNGVKWPSDNLDAKAGSYHNNISLHRVEIEPFSNFKFSVWESCIWRKRFELAYVNPFTIYMFAQNNLGDYDNVLAGFDFSYTVQGLGMFYFAFAMDEMNSFSKPFSCPRNMLSYQLGAKLQVPVFNFSEVVVQATYIPAFFGSHYATKRLLFGDVEYTTAYVNKGQNLGYPLNPDSLEILLNFSTTLSDGWKINAVIKDQMRSAQYAVDENGTTILTTMDYHAYDDFDGEWGSYYGRDFFNNIWNNILYAELEVEKRLSTMPIELSFSAQFMNSLSRTFVPQKNVYEIEYNPGKVVFTSDWESISTFLCSVGVKVFY